MVDTGRIKQRMAELGLTQADIAECLGIARPTANQKVNNVRKLEIDEAKKLSELLDIKDSEIWEYFCK
jgi:transcriptional regulator with XRE-family HTH domain